MVDFRINIYRISSEGKSIMYEWEENCIHAQRQIYETKFGNDADRLHKVMRRISNQILGFKKFIQIENFTKINDNQEVLIFINFNITKNMVTS